MVALFVLAIFILVLVVDFFVLKFQGKVHPAFETDAQKFSPAITDAQIIPAGVYHTKGHVWLKNLDQSLVQLGIDLFGAKALGNLSLVKCAEVGKEINRGDVLFEASNGSSLLKFLSPIDGTIKQTNKNILGKSVSNPYEAWGIQMIPKNFKKQKEFLFNGEKAKNWIKEEFARLKDFVELNSAFSSLVGETMYDGGLPVDGIESIIDENTVKNFEKEFLTL